MPWPLGCGLTPNARRELELDWNPVRAPIRFEILKSEPRDSQPRESNAATPLGVERILFLRS